MDATAAVDSSRRARPTLVWVISIAYFALPLAAVFGVIAIHAGLFPGGVLAHPYFQTVNVVDLTMSLLLAAAEVAGALLLWRMRRRALHLFLAATFLGMLNFWWQVLIRNWVGAIKRIYPSMTAAAIISTVLGQLILVAVCVYIWRLTRAGVLR